MLDLLSQIVRCGRIAHHYSHAGCQGPCYRIIGSQNACTISALQVPEPWTGHIESAPILFLSSNPSIDRAEHYPLWSWPDGEIVDFFVNRFEKWIEDGIRHWEATGGFRRKPTRYWIEVRSRASELLGRPTREIVPGRDYALSEVVHCKSAGEKHVESARQECADLYLRSLIEASVARVVVCLGQHAKNAVRHIFRDELTSLSDQKKPYVLGPLVLGGKERCIAFMRHPNYRGQRKFENCLPDEIDGLRKFLNA